MIVDDVVNGFGAWQVESERVSAGASRQGVIALVAIPVCRRQRLRKVDHPHPATRMVRAASSCRSTRRLLKAANLKWLNYIAWALCRNALNRARCPFGNLLLQQTQIMQPRARTR